MNTLTRKLIQAVKAKVKRISDSIEIENDERSYSVIRVTRKDSRRFRFAALHGGDRLLVEECDGGVLRMNNTTNYLHDNVKPFLRNSLIEVEPS